ncbi:MAG: hypothetical protein QOC61_502 [Acidobacteriota bacterium]|nr:hypothetical protein [Acidobacteriota bacterium]MDT5261498.1 hypothetical protein [Acidobacteriota bacterium]MDT7780306.1 hypothetical protein [Acidobacteriota bacterium]
MVREFQPIAIDGVDRDKTGIDNNGKYNYHFTLSSLPTSEWQAVFNQNWKKHISTIGAASFYANEPTLRVHSGSIDDAHKVIAPLKEVIGAVNCKFTKFEKSVDSLEFGEKQDSLEFGEKQI